MKACVKIAPLVIALALLSPFLSTAADLSSLDTTIQILQEQIARQIERIQAARQKADNQMTVARFRVQQQLERAQQDLAVQVERLQQYRTLLQDKTRETEETIAFWQNQGSGLIGKTLGDVAEQINETSRLMQKLDQLKSQVDCNSPNQGRTSQEIQGPQSNNGGIPVAASPDIIPPSTMKNVAMLTVPDSQEPLTFAPPLGPTG